MGLFDFLFRKKEEKYDLTIKPNDGHSWSELDKKLVEEHVEKLNSERSPERITRNNKLKTQYKKRKLSPAAYKNVTNARKTSKAGREKVPVFHYDRNGAFIKKYEAISDALQEHFNRSRGPLFNDALYKRLPDGTFLTKTRLGREGLRRIVAITESEYCKHLDNDKPIEVYNLKDELVASFNSARVAHHMTGIDQSTISASLERSLIGKQFPKNGLKFKYKV